MSRKQKKMLVRIVLAAAMMVGLLFVPAEGTLRFCLWLVPYLVIGYDILLRAARGIRNRQLLDENFLMAVATIGAMALGLSGSGDYTEGVAVMLFYQIGEWFQRYAVGKSRRNISELMDIRPDYANVEREGSLESVDPDEVEPGTMIVVRPGERVPIDGVVAEGTSSLNTAALTGESLPRDVAVGDEIISGCINLTGLLKIRTTKAFGESTVSRILDLVENAGSRKSRQEAFISRFARVYTPAVCGAALALAVMPPLVRMLVLDASANWSVWVYRALTFLVMSCPCALVVSIPLSFFGGIGGAGKAGILVKGSNYLEALSKTDCVVFDKTGTLTEGSFEVAEIRPVGLEKDALLELAALAECASSHPISKSLQRACGTAPDCSRVREIREISGQGVTALVDGRPVAVGNASLMAEQGLTCSSCEPAGTIVHVAVDGRYAGAIAIADRIKEESATAVAALKKSGIRKTVMLTGDAKSVADRVAAELGIDEVCGELLPGDKVAEVERLLGEKRAGTNLVFVGDGINDAPVLARADIGIAMGAMGSDAAIEAADVVLMDDNPLKLVKAIRISQKCLRIVRQNTVFAIGVKLICLILGAFGVANMWLAIFADVGVMMLAVLNAVRALFVDKL